MTGYISLGHAVFFGVGAYVMVLSFNTLPFWASVILAGLVGAALALLVGYPCLRVRGPYFVILTFGLAELVKFIVVNVEAGLGQSTLVLDQAYYNSWVIQPHRSSQTASRFEPRSLPSCIGRLR